MIPSRTISPETARRFLARRHLLAPPRSLPAEPESVMTVVGRLGSLQFDPLDIAGRNHDLVLLSRISGYRRAWTDALLYDDRRLFEAYNKGLSLLPTSELPWFRATWDRARARHEAESFVQHRAAVDDLLERIRAEGPLRSIDFDPGPLIDWYWRPTRRTRAMLEALAESGILGLVEREGNRRRYDLIERLFEPELLAHRPTLLEQRRHRLLSRYRAHGLLGRTGSAELWLGTVPSRRSEKHDGPTRDELLADLLDADLLAPVEIDGLRGERFVLAEEIDLLAASETEVSRAPAAETPWMPVDGAAAGVAFLAPLDPFVWDRDFLRRLFGFDYIWEVYVPEAKRIWGYYVLPILYGERLVGRIEPRLDRKAGLLRIVNLWWQDGFDPLAQPGFVDAFTDALDAHRRFLDVRGVGWPRVHRNRALAAEMRVGLAARARAAPRSRRAIGHEYRGPPSPLTSRSGVRLTRRAACGTISVSGRAAPVAASWHPPTGT